MRARVWITERWGGPLLALLLTLAALAALPIAHGQERSSAVVRGEQLVQAKCSGCHATGRTGASPNPKAPAFRDVGRVYPPEHLAEALAEGIVTGAKDMPAFKFGPEDVDAIIEYLSVMSSASKR